MTITSCSSLVQSKFTEKKLPSLATIGNFNNYLLEDLDKSKAILEIDAPIRLEFVLIHVEEKKWFSKSDQIDESKNSTLVSVHIIDQIRLLQQLNSNIEILKYLKKGDNYRIVSQVTVNYPKAILDLLETADELYLIQNRLQALSIELRKDNKTLEVIEFSDGTIVSYTPSEFCWGLNRKRQVEIFDLVSVGANCSEDLYKTARKAKLKNEFKF